jgi:stage II sporulation protein D
VTFAGKPVATYFFSTSGGRTENVENSFLGSTPQPWLRSVEDPYDDVSPRHRWGPYRWSFRTVKRKLGSLVKGSFRSIRVSRRGASPRIVSATIVGSRGSTTASGPQLRARLGLYDSWVYFNSLSTNVTPPPDEGSQTTPGGGLAPRALVSGVRPRAQLRGRVSPRPAGGWVRVQRRAGDAWVDVVQAQVTSGGRYAARVAFPGTYRVVSGEDPGPSVRVG